MEGRGLGRGINGWGTNKILCGLTNIDKGPRSGD